MGFEFVLVLLLRIDTVCVSVSVLVQDVVSVWPFDLLPFDFGGRLVGVCLGPVVLEGTSAIVEE